MPRFSGDLTSLSQRDTIRTLFGHIPFSDSKFMDYSGFLPSVSSRGQGSRSNRLVSLRSHIERIPKCR